MSVCIPGLHDDVVLRAHRVTVGIVFRNAEARRFKDTIRQGKTQKRAKRCILTHQKKRRHLFCTLERHMHCLVCMCMEILPGRPILVALPLLVLQDSLMSENWGSSSLYASGNSQPQVGARMCVSECACVCACACVCRSVGRGCRSTGFNEYKGLCARVFVCVTGEMGSDFQCLHEMFWQIHRVGHNHIYTVCIRYFWQGNHQIYGHIRCIYTVLANPTNTSRHLFGTFCVACRFFQQCPSFTQCNGHHCLRLYSHACNLAPVEPCVEPTP
jgi:adenosyl cobinamide kinase/adenosyl cobinamide phosphate guanylyltransferase